MNSKFYIMKKSARGLDQAIWYSFIGPVNSVFFTLCKNKFRYDRRVFPNSSKDRISLDFINYTNISNVYLYINIRYNEYVFCNTLHNIYIECSPKEFFNELKESNYIFYE